MGRGSGLKSSAVVALGILGTFAAAGPGYAATLKATPSIALEETWDTNIFNTASDEQSDFISRATPGLSFLFESERATFTLSGSITSEAYADNHDLNNWDSTKRVELGAPSLKASQRLSLRAAARYLETNDISRRNELALAPIPDLPPAETLVVGRTATRVYGGSVGASYQATPNIELGAGGGGTKTEYLERATGLTGSRTVTGNVSGRYRFSPRTTGGVTGSTASTAYDDGAHSRSHSAGLTGSFALTERTGIEASAGATFVTDTRATGVVERDQSPYGRLSISHRAGSFSATLAGAYELSGGGSFGQATERTNASLALADQLTPKWSWDINGYYQNERTAGAGGGREIETAGGTAGVRFAAADWIAFRLAGYTFRQWNRDTADSDIARSHVVLGLTLSDTSILF